MIESGLLARSADERDSRARVLEITAAGRTALDEWFDLLGRTLAPRFADLDDADWAAVDRVAGILAAKTRTSEVAR